MENEIHHNDGPAHAAMLAAGIGSAVLGLATILAEAFGPIKEVLNWWTPAGPLSGKTGIAVLAWLASWGLLHLAWRRYEIIRDRTIWTWTLVLIFAGWMGTFPPVFEAFSGH